MMSKCYKKIWIIASQMHANRTVSAFVQSLTWEQKRPLLFCGAVERRLFFF